MLNVAFFLMAATESVTAVAVEFFTRRALA
jgi:hypothetical protein